MIVRFKIAIIKTMRLQALAHQAKVLRFFCRHTQPIQLKLGGNAAKAVSRVQRQIDGIEFNVRHRMQ